jgi:hypothetical protein
MIKILETIWNFIKSAFSPKYIGLTFGVIIFVLVTSLFKTCGDLNREKDARKNDAVLYENNVKAATDSLKTYYDKKLDAMVTEKTSYMINQLSDLKSYNEKLYNEFKGVKNLVVGIKSDVNIIIPTLTDVINNIPISDPDDSTKFTLPFNFNYKDEGLSQTLIGNTHFRILDNKPQIPIISTLTTNTFDIKLKYNINKDKNGNSVVQATSPSKLVRFTELDGALVLPKTTKPPRFVFGPQVGFGLNTDIVGQGARFGWSVGVGGTYNIFVK